MREYQDFHWASPAPANGESGKGLADSLLALIKKLGHVHSICDLGCGNGYLAARLAELGYSVTGVDASPSGVKIARENHPDVRFVCLQIDAQTQAGLASSGFDLVISSDVIEHLYRPSDLLEAASSLLGPGGQLVICTPYHGYLKNLALSITGRMEAHFTALWDGGHIKFFSVKTLSELVRSHSFTDLRFSYYGRAPYMWKNMICHARKSL
jgi:2-polyprenyl-3-methyl-5-hydroxy-6-metoxy-1,4-benzoquinol methylase